MPRISEIHAKRERIFYKNRMAGNKQRERAENLRLVVENEHLLPRIRASEMRQEVVDEPMTEEMTVHVPVQNEKRKREIKQRLLVGGGIEKMDVD